MRRRYWVALALVVLFLPTMAQGRAAQTLASRKAIRIEPAAWDLFNIGITYRDVMSKSGYQYYEYMTLTKPTTQRNFLPVLADMISGGDIGSLMEVTHGDPAAWLTQEAYGKDTTGLRLQTQALDEYWSRFAGEIAAVDVPDEANPGKIRAHCISVNSWFFLSRWVEPLASSALVDIRACYGWNMRGGFPGATFCSSDNIVLNTDSQTGINSMYLSLGGVTNGVRGRVLRNAISGQLPIWHITGDLDLTLCPAVVAQTPTKDELERGIDYRVTARVTFDTKVAWPPDDTYIMLASGAAYIYNVEAESDTTLLFALTGTQKAAWGKVEIFAGTNGSYWNGITGYPAYTGLDGDGIYPNGQSYAFDYYSLLGDNPAAVIGGFTVTRETAGLTARWVVESEQNTYRYWLEHAAGPLDSFALVAEVSATGANVYQVKLNGPTEGFYRLREVETGGKILTHAYTSVEDPQPVSTNLVEAIPTEELERQNRQSNQAEQILTSYTDVIYTITAFLTPAQSIANDQTSVGKPTIVKDIGTLVGGAAGIKADFAARMAFGARNMMKFGDANDDRDAQGNLRYGNPAVWDSQYVKPGGSTPQPQYNLIPVALYPMVWGPQSTSMTGSQKFYPNDWVDIDMDGDGLPDPGLSLGRYPATSLDEANNLAYKARLARQISINTPGVNEVFAFTYAFDVYGNSGAEAESTMTSVLTGLPSGLVVDRYVDKPSHWYSESARDALCINHFNSGAGLHIYTGTTISRYHNSGCLDQNRHAPLTGLNGNANRLAFVIVLGCGGGDFERTELDSVGRPLNEQLLENRNERGIWGYVGGSRGTWQYGNRVFGQELIRQLYSVGAPSVSQAVARTVYNVATAYPELKTLALSYYYVGPTNVPLAGQVINTTGVDDQPISSPLALAPPAPNPSYGTASIHFTLPTTSLVDIGVYDVMGRRLETIVSGTLSAGRHSQSVRMNYAPGEYFVRMVADKQDRVQKMVIVR